MTRAFVRNYVWVLLHLGWPVMLRSVDNWYSCWGRDRGVGSARLQRSSKVPQELVPILQAEADTHKPLLDALLRRPVELCVMCEARERTHIRAHEREVRPKTWALLAPERVVERARRRTTTSSPSRSQTSQENAILTENTIPSSRHGAPTCTTVFIERTSIERNSRDFRRRVEVIDNFK